MSLKTGIVALRLRFEPQDWNLSLKTGFQARGGYTGGEGEGEISPCVKAYNVFKSKWQIANLCSSKTTSPEAFKSSVNVGNK